MDDDLKALGEEAGLTDDEKQRLDEHLGGENQDDADAGGDEHQDVGSASEVEEVAAAPEEPEEEQPAADAKPARRKKPKLIDELTDERAKRREFEKVSADQTARADAAEALMAKMDERFKLVVASQREPEAKPAEPEAPTLEDSPVDYLLNEIEQLKTGQQTLSDTGRQTAEQTTFNMAVTNDYNAFTAKTPDTEQAFSHLVEHLNKMYTAAGIADPNQRVAQIQREVGGISRMALQSGASPSERIYELAKAVGYTPGAAPADPGPSSSDIARVAAGQAAVSGMPSGGSGGLSSMGLRAVAEMDDKDFDALIKKEMASGKHGSEDAAFAAIMRAGMN